METNYLLVIISSLFSGILGLVISNLYHYKMEKYRMKLSILTKLMGNRHERNSKEYLEALNSIFIYFNSNKKILDVLNGMHDNLSNQDDKLLSLVKLMCRDLRVNIDNFNDSFITGYFIAVQKNDKTLK